MLKIFVEFCRWTNGSKAHIAQEYSAFLENKSVQVGITDGYMFYQKCSKDRCYQYKRNGISRIKKMNWMKENTVKEISVGFLYERKLIDERKYELYK